MLFVDYIVTSGCVTRTCSVNIIVRLDFEGHDVSNETIEEAISNMEYSFTYDDYYLRILNHEIVDSFVKMDS